MTVDMRERGYLRALGGQRDGRLRFDALSKWAQDAYTALARRGMVTIDHRHVSLTAAGREEARD